MNFKTRLAAGILNHGGVISTPTDTIQGLMCSVKFEESVRRVVHLKARSSTKGLILLASDIAYVADYVKNLKLLESIVITPEPTTYLLPASEYASELLTGEFDTIAIRLTNNKLIVDLCQATNDALVSTSANISGYQTAQSAMKLRVYFKDQLDFIISPKMDNSVASKIINLQTGKRIR